MRATFDKSAKSILLKQLQSKHFKTTDSHHSYMNEQDEIVYQWGIIIDEDECDPSHLLIIFETTDKQQYDTNKRIALKFLRENGGWE